MQGHGGSKGAQRAAAQPEATTSVVGFLVAGVLFVAAVAAVLIVPHQIIETLPPASIPVPAADVPVAPGHPVDSCSDAPYLLQCAGWPWPDWAGSPDAGCAPSPAADQLVSLGLRAANATGLTLDVCKLWSLQHGARANLTNGLVDAAQVGKLLLGNANAAYHLRIVPNGTGTLPPLRAALIESASDATLGAAGLSMLANLTGSAVDALADDGGAENLSALFSAAHDVVVLGANADPTAFGTAADQQAVGAAARDWVQAGGTLVVMGTPAGVDLNDAASWLAPLVASAQATASTGLGQGGDVADLGHPTDPGILAYPATLSASRMAGGAGPYAASTLGGALANVDPAVFTTALHDADGPLVVVSDAGAFGQGMVVLTRYEPARAVGDPEAERLMGNILAQSQSAWFLDTGHTAGAADTLSLAGPWDVMVGPDGAQAAKAMLWTWTPGS